MKPNPSKTRTFISLSLLVTALATLLYSTQAAPLGTAFTYQGRLVDNGSPANGNYDLRFTLYDALSAGGTIGIPIANAPTVVSNGLFTVTLDFGGGIFLGNARWLELGVRTNGSVLAYTPLTPRQELTPSPNALYAPNAGTATTANGVAAGSVGTAGLAPNAVNSSIIANGSIVANDLNPTLLLNTFWRLDGNAGITPGVSFLGTPDNNALDFRVNNVRGLRIEPDTFFGSPNVIGGSAANFVSSDSVGNFIGAGGQSGWFDGTNSILSGGNMNVIGGGWNNTISNAYEGTIAGGYYNSVGNSHATVGGGEYNFASGVASTVPGGGNNTAAGNYSFAAGNHAKANHEGSFVWADNSTGADFASAADNQFLVRAGFVGINRATPVSGAEYFGILAPVSNNWGGMYIQTLTAGRPFYGYANDGVAWTELDGTDGNKWKLYNAGYWLTVTTSGNVGIGTTTPASRMDILGGLWDLSNSEGDFRIGSDAFRLKIGVATGGGGSGDARIRAQGGTSRLMLGSDTNDVLTVVGTNVGIGTISPSAPLHVAGDTRVEGVTRAGSETGTAQTPDKGIMTRRVRSTFTAAGGVVARTDKLTLERDGSNGGWRIANVAFPGITTIAFTGITSAGATVNFVTSFFNPAAAGTTTVFTDAQNVVSLRGSFGDSYSVIHMTEVSLTRYPGDSYWTGTLTSTFNQ